MLMIQGNLTARTNDTSNSVFNSINYKVAWVLWVAFEVNTFHDNWLDTFQLKVLKREITCIKEYFRGKDWFIRTKREIISSNLSRHGIKVAQRAASKSLTDTNESQGETYQRCGNMEMECSQRWRLWNLSCRLWRMLSWLSCPWRRLSHSHRTMQTCFPHVLQLPLDTS